MTRVFWLFTLVIFSFSQSYAFEPFELSEIRMKLAQFGGITMDKIPDYPILSSYRQESKPLEFTIRQDYQDLDLICSVIAEKKTHSVAWDYISNMKDAKPGQKVLLFGYRTINTIEDGLFHKFRFGTDLSITIYPEGHAYDDHNNKEITELFRKEVGTREYIMISLPVPKGMPGEFTSIDGFVCDGTRI